MCTAYGFAKSLKDYLHWFPFVGAHAVSVAWSNEVRKWEHCLQRPAVALNNGPIQAIVHRWTPAPSKYGRAATHYDHLNTRRLTAPSLAQLQNENYMFCASYVYLFIYVGRVLPVHNHLLDGYTRPQLHSTSPKDGWTGPWMRRWCTIARQLHKMLAAKQQIFVCAENKC